MGTRVYVVTPADMRCWEQEQFAKGFSAEVMMESVGAQLWGRLQDLARGVALPHCVILAGGGNNGGDALVLARYAVTAGWRVTVIDFGKRRSELCALVSNRLEQSVDGTMMWARYSAQDVDDALTVLATADIVVEGISGIGYRGAPDGEVRRWVTAVNEWHLRKGAMVAAIDVPVGVDAESGAADGAALRADVTWMVGWPKRGLYWYPACAYAGEKVRIPLGLPPADWQTQLAVPGIPELVTPQRQGNAHKGTQGHVAILAGSEGMEGAALLAAQAALYSGAGKVTLWVPGAVRGRLAALVPEVMVRGVGEADTWGAAMCPDTDFGDYDALVIGCGIGRSPQTQAWVGSVLSQWHGPTVIDADGLFALAQQPDITHTSSWILTPHAGELARLAGSADIGGETERWERSGQVAAAYEAVVVAKGAPTVTVLPSGARYVNTTGNPGLATAGTGDTLAGIIGGLLAQGLTVTQAAVSGAYWHGAAADVLASGGYGFTAGMVARALPGVMGKGATDATN